MAKRAIIFGIAIMLVALGIWTYLHRSVELEKNPIILGHAGMGMRHYLPMNSFRSIERALSYPVSGTEIDIRMTKDGLLIAFHDDSLNSHTNCEGRIFDNRYDDLTPCSLDGWFGSEPIISLREILAKPWPDSSVFCLDLKPPVGASESEMNMYKASIGRDIDRHPEYNFLIESQDIELLSMLKSASIRATFFYYAHQIPTDIELVQDAKLDGISIDLKLIDKTGAEAIREAGLLLMIWGAGSVRSNRDALELQPDLIQTDDIPSMMRLLHGQPRIRKPIMVTSPA